MRLSLVWVLLLGSHLQNAVLGFSFFFLFSFVVAVVFNTFASPSAGGKCSSQEERERSSCVLGDGETSFPAHSRAAPRGSLALGC